MLLDGLLRTLNRLLERCVVVQIFKDLLARVGVQDHADNAAGQFLVNGGHLDVEVFAEEVLLLLRATTLCYHLHRNHLLLGLLLLLDWHWHRLGCLLAWLLGRGRLSAAESWEARLVYGDALLLRAASDRIGLVSVLLLLLLIGPSVVVSSLVWILLRLVVAVLLIVLPRTAAGLAVVTLIVVRLLTVLLPALRGRTRPLLLRVVPCAALVVIPVHARLVLGVLLLILIPASATGDALACALSEPALIIVSSTI